MGWSIICRARQGHRMGIRCLALVDRSKSKSGWWTSDNTCIILHYRSKTAAEYACKRLRRNKPEVVTYECAVRLIKEQDCLIMEHEATEAMGEGWDGHKDSF